MWPVLSLEVPEEDFSYIGSSNATIHNALIANNTASQGGGMMTQSGNIVVTASVLLIQNTASYYGGGATLIDTSLNNSGTLEFIQNSAGVYGGGIVLMSSNITVTGHILLKENSATSTDNSNGGGMVLRPYSAVTVYGTMSLTNNLAIHSGGGILINETSTIVVSGTIYFNGNKAGLGGAIFATDMNRLVYCSSQIHGAECVRNHCFFKNISEDHNKSLMVFEGNKAQSGDVVFGGAIDTCRLEGQPNADSGSIFNKISDFSKQPRTQSVFSSYPYRVCICEEESLLCGEVGAFTAYPGETFSFDAVTVGQRNGTVIIHTIYAVVNPPEIARLGPFEDRQKAIGCTKVNYTLFSNPGTNQLELYVYGSCSSLEGSLNHLQIPVDLRPCPRGFMLSMSPPYGCICEDRLQKFTNSCNINGQTILRDRDYWVGYDNESDSQGLILHPHCPFDYCKSKAINFTLNDIDLQCNNDRTGLLCGACKPGLSLIIGKNKCLPCTNNYLALLIAFALMGIALMLFFLVFQLFTVKAGVISGLIFYASIVGANQNIFYPPGRKNIVGFFVMWFKLDLGIETCFYDGMDIYAKTWLQFVFPIYLFCLISLLILLKRLSPQIAQRLPVSEKHLENVLATFFILSYGKIVKNVISVFSYTTLLYPNNKTEKVWLYDANIKYLHGKHIPLFVVSVLFTVLVILPFTLLLLFGHVLEKLPKRFLWITKPVSEKMNIFYKPYVENHRYWPGLLLLVRLALFVIFGMNALHDYSENLLAISAAVFGLIAWPWLIKGQVYKPKFKWFGLLESTFMLNLGVFACATLYVQQSGGNQAAVAYVSTGVAFASFLVTFLYHIVYQKDQIKKGLVWIRSHHKVHNDEDESASLINTSKSYQET